MTIATVLMTSRIDVNEARCVENKQSDLHGIIAMDFWQVAYLAPIGVSCVVTASPSKQKAELMQG